ncbi:MAG: helix-turn-helix domain-containing protein [Candidatus Marinimicrobia bacterium]|nr:helix-turn-helix domain-containing protein [Candidatus Neomarinimicrobiota bacterium]
MIILSDLYRRECKVVQNRVRILDQYTSLKKQGYTKQEACQKLSVSRQTISRWSTAFRERGLAGLVDEMSKRRSGKSKMSEAQVDFLHKAYRKNPSPNLMALHRDEYLHFCEILQQEPISYATFRRAFKRIQKNQKIQDVRDRKKLERMLQEVKQKERTNG